MDACLEDNNVVPRLNQRVVASAEERSAVLRSMLCAPDSSSATIWALSNKPYWLEQHSLHQRSVSLQRDIQQNRVSSSTTVASVLQTAGDLEIPLALGYASPSIKQRMLATTLQEAEAQRRNKARVYIFRPELKVSAFELLFL